MQSGRGKFRGKGSVRDLQCFQCVFHIRNTLIMTQDPGDQFKGSNIDLVLANGMIDPVIRKIQPAMERPDSLVASKYNGVFPEISAVPIMA